MHEVQRRCCRILPCAALWQGQPICTTRQHLSACVHGVELPLPARQSWKAETPVLRVLLVYSSVVRSAATYCGRHARVCLSEKKTASCASLAPLICLMPELRPVACWANSLAPLWLGTAHTMLRLHMSHAACLLAHVTTSYHCNASHTVLSNSLRSVTIPLATRACPGAASCTRGCVCVFVRVWGAMACAAPKCVQSTLTRHAHGACTEQ